MRQCDNYSTSEQAQCCYAEGHSGEHFFSRQDESDRIRWKLAADQRDAVMAERDTLRVQLQQARSQVDTMIAVHDEVEKDLSRLSRELEAMTVERERLAARVEELEKEGERHREFISASSECSAAIDIVALDDDNQRYRQAFNAIIKKHQDGDHEIRSAFCSWCGESWPHLNGDTAQETKKHAQKHAMQCAQHPLRIALDSALSSVAELKRENERLAGLLAAPCGDDVRWHNNGRGPRVAFLMGDEDFVITADRAMALGAALIRTALEAKSALTTKPGDS
jgi:chromosome segregation ATPase